MSRSKYSAEEKYKILMEYEAGNGTLQGILYKYDISKYCFYQWKDKYKKDGIEGLKESKTWKRYSKELKYQAVKDYISGKYSYKEIMRKYDISSHSLVQKWIMKYNSHRGLKGTPKGMNRSMTKGRPTKWKEKIEIVMDCIYNDMNYKKAARTRKEAILSRIRQEDKYIAIKELNEEEKYSISLLCRIAKVSRSGYYKWLKRKKSNQETENEILLREIIKLYKKVDGIYGYRRITMNLNKKFKTNYNHKRIYRLMKIAGLKSVIRKKKKRYVKSNPQHVAKNLLNREFEAEKSNKKWVTEFKYGTQKAYLSAILDLHDKSIVSYVLGHSNNNQLVFKTLDKALKNNPEATPMIHSDRGFQYTSHGFKRRIDTAGMIQSMSRVGKMY